MISQYDRTILRDLAKRIADIADLPVMAERKALWTRHNSLQRVRPMLLIFPEGAWGELVPWDSGQCEEARLHCAYELGLRHQLYGFAHFHSDNVVEKAFIVQKVMRDTGWGLEARQHAATAEGGSWGFDPVITGPEDLKKLRYPDVIYDEAATLAAYDEAQELFGDILEVKIKGVAHLSYHLMNQYTGWRGLEQTMMDMYEEPEMLHEGMAFLEEGHRRLLQQYCDLNLLSLNNDNTYHSTGGNGYTDELPAPGFDPDRVRPCDMWASAEAQEMAQVSPAMHAEFILPYEKRLLEPFGLNGYGCCEDLTHKLDDVLTIPNIRRISISPWANVDACAEQLGNRAIFSWKPHPAHLVGDFDAEQVRAYIQHTVDVCQANGCVLEIILKDTHTVEHHPERFDQWSQIARDVVAADES